MKKRVYGIIGIVSRMSNWNADFTGYPKTTSDGSVFGSDKALKYPMKVMWNQQGEKVLYIKSFKRQESKKQEIELTPRSLTERYDYLFPESDDQGKDKTLLLKNLFATIDVKNFGATFAAKGNNLSITGAVQIGQGMNKYKDSIAFEQQILSPFRDDSDKNKVNKDNKSDKEDAKATTLGTKIISDEAHYFYPFVINPTSYDEFVDLGVTEGYTEEDYMKFKDTALVSATAFNTNAKIGCENEFAVFIETEPDIYLPDLSRFVTFTKDEDSNFIKFDVGDILNPLSDRIKCVEIYYNPHTLQVQHNIKNVKEFNIFSRKEMV